MNLTLTETAVSEVRKFIESENVGNDGGLRVPFMMRLPGRIQAGTRCDYAGLTFDLFPTFIELAGQVPAPRRPSSNATGTTGTQPRQTHAGTK